MEYNHYFENEQCLALSIKLDPHEETGLHYDVYPAVVIARVGGTVTRIEADGSRTYVEFPTGVPVYRPAETSDKMHRTVNEGMNPIELVIVQLK